MKNSYISSAQFYFSMLLSVIVSLLFISPTCSVFGILPVLITSLVSIAVFLFYDGVPSAALKAVLYVYFLLLSVVALVRLSRYMKVMLDSGPYWAIISIIVIAAFFCTVKGCEALSRAALIIGFFCVFFILYIVIGLFPAADYSAVDVGFKPDLFPALICFYPCAVYASQNRRIRGERVSHKIIFCASSFALISVFIFFSSTIKKCFPVHFLSKSVSYGVFKGGDCLLLTLLTVSVLYVLSNSALSVCKNQKQFRKSSAVFLSLVYIFALLTAYFYPVSEFLINEKTVFAVTTLVLIVIFISIWLASRERRKKYQ